jgi:hypothetical protein
MTEFKQRTKQTPLDLVNNYLPKGICDQIIGGYLGAFQGAKVIEFKSGYRCHPGMYRDSCQAGQLDVYAGEECGNMCFDSDVLTMKSVVFLNNSHFLEMCPLHKVKFLMKQRISQIPYELSFKVQQREGPRGNFYWFKLSKKHNRQLLQGPTLRV